MLHLNVTVHSLRSCSLKGYHDEFVQFIRADDANTHGIRKGSTRKASSGTSYALHLSHPLRHVASGAWGKY